MSIAAEQSWSNRWNHKPENVFRSFVARLRYLVAKIWISEILSSYNYLCKINCAFKKKSRFSVIAKQNKDIKGNKGKICIYSNVSIAG